MLHNNTIDLHFAYGPVFGVNYNLRYYIIQAANLMRLHIPEYAKYYARKHKEASKHHHKRALVLTARKSVGLVVGLLHRDEPYRSKEDRRT